MIDGHLLHLSYSEHLDIMMDKDHPTIHIPQITMTHHPSSKEFDKPMNHTEKDRRGSTNMKEEALGTEKELDTTSTEDK